VLRLSPFRLAVENLSHAHQALYQWKRRDPVTLSTGAELDEVGVFNFLNGVGNLPDVQGVDPADLVVPQITHDGIDAWC
jgi:hypothetical protein